MRRCFPLALEHFEGGLGGGSELRPPVDLHRVEQQLDFALEPVELRERRLGGGLVEEEGFLEVGGVDVERVGEVRQHRRVGDVHATFPTRHVVEVGGAGEFVREGGLTEPELEPALP